MQKTTAVLEIGSSGIRLCIANINTGDELFEILENESRPTLLGSDVFLHGIVSLSVINECVEILSSYKELLQGYGLHARQVHAIASSALREASNKDSFIDIILMRTGFKIKVLEDLEENHYMYFAVMHALDKEKENIGTKNSLIIEIGGGSTEILLIKRGQIEAVHSFQLGTIRIASAVQSADGSTESILRIIQDHVNTITTKLNAELPLQSIENVIIMGSDARLLASAEHADFFTTYWRLQVQNFLDNSEKIARYSEIQCIQQFDIDACDAVTMRYGLLILREFIKRTNAQTVFIPAYSMREGYLLSLVVSEKNKIQKELKKHILASARSIGRKFSFDEAHANCVRKNILKLFDTLEFMHNLTKRDRLLAELAALLHDIGVFIRSGSHHKHSEYIISNSEIFSITNDERIMIACIARYHRKGGPNSTHSNFMFLDKADRIRVLKLSALLRIADVLDHNHNQAIEVVSAERKSDNIIIYTNNSFELSLLQQEIKKKADLFEFVFGYSVVVV